MNSEELSAEDAVVAEIVEPMSPPRARPWGLWATLGFSLGVFIAFAGIQTAVVLVYMLSQWPKPPAPDEIGSNGLLVAVATWLAAPFCCAAVIVLAKLRRGFPIRDYLALNGFSAARFLGWAAILLGFVVLTDGGTWLLGRDVVPVFMIDAYRTAVFVPLLLAALWIAAPVFEEVFFRGFLFRGLQESKLGNVGAVLITSLTWSVIHLQYDAFQIATIFLCGILLGIARARSNSVYLTIGLHALMNLVATIELWVYLWTRT